MVYEYDGKERLFTGHSGRIFILLTVIWLCISLTSRLLPPLLPVIMEDLAITAFLAGLALTVERIVRAGVEYPSGRFADQLTRTSVLVVCVSIVILSLIILSISFSYVLFVIAIIVFGLGRGMYTPPTRALLSDIFLAKRGRAFGFNMMGSEFAGILGAGLAIVIVTYATWRAAFLPLALLLIPLLVGFYLLSREPIEFQSVDLGVQETGLRIFGDPSLRWLLIVYSLYVLAASGVSTFLPTFLIDVHGVSFAFASSAFALLYVVGFFSKPTSGYLSDIFPRSLVAAAALIVGAGGLALLVSAPYELLAIGGVIIYAFGYRGISPALHAFMMDRFSDETMGGDFGAMRTIYLMVGSLGPAYAGLAGSVLGFVPAFTSFLVFYIIGAGILLWFSIRGWPTVQPSQA